MKGLILIRLVEDKTFMYFDTQENARDAMLPLHEGCLLSRWQNKVVRYFFFWKRCFFQNILDHSNTIELQKHNVEYHAEDIQWFDVEYGIYCTSETGFFKFSRLRGASENIRLSCLTSEMNSVFIVKLLNVLFITFSLVFQILHTSTACKTRRDVTIVCNFHTFHTVKITLCIFSHWENNSP